MHLELRRTFKEDYIWRWEKARQGSDNDRIVDKITCSLEGGHALEREV